MTPDNAKVEAALAVLRVAAASIRSGTFAASATAHNIEQALATLTEALAERERDAGRWVFYASSPQTALMLGSQLDPNKRADWKAECDRLADAAMQGESHD